MITGTLERIDNPSTPPPPVQPGNLDAETPAYDILEQAILRAIDNVRARIVWARRHDCGENTKSRIINRCKADLDMIRDVRLAVARHGFEI